MPSKKDMPAVRRVRTRGTPVPMPTRKPNRAPGQAIPVPMPTRVPNLSLPPDQRAKAKPMPIGPKKQVTPKIPKPVPIGPKKQVTPKIPKPKKIAPSRRKMI
jgi:hypothetical protein